MVRLGELMMILELHRQGVSVTAIARRTGRDPKTVRKYIERGIEAPVYGPRTVGRPSKLAAYLDFLRERVTAFPELSAARLTREIRELGYAGAYTAVKRYLAAIRPENGPKPYEVRFETPPGEQAQVDFARFVVNFTDEPGTSRIVWLFSMVLGHSRFIFARFVMHQDLQTLLRCHIAGVRGAGRRPDRDPLRSHEDGRDRRGRRPATSSIIGRCWRSRSIIGFHPRACRPYRAKTKGKVERPFSYIRQDFFLGTLLPQSRRSQRSARRLARHRRQRPRSTAPRSVSSPRRLPPSSPSCRRCQSIVRRGAQARAPGQPRRASSRSAATTTACPTHPPCRRGAATARRDPHPRSRQHRCRPSRSRRPPAEPRRPEPSHRRQSARSSRAGIAAESHHRRARRSGPTAIARHLPGGRQRSLAIGGRP